MVAAVLWPVLYALQPISLAAAAPTWVDLGRGLRRRGGDCGAPHALVRRSSKRKCPSTRSRESASYDALGSFVLTPLGLAIAGPLAAGIGLSRALWLAAAMAILQLSTAILLAPSAWAVRRREPAATLAA